MDSRSRCAWFIWWVHCVVLGLLLCASTAPVLAATWRVPADFSTIQDAMDASQPCDVVLVGPGTYSERVSVREGVRLIADGEPGEVILRPERDDQGMAASEVVVLTNGSTVEGFTLRDAVIGISFTGLWSEARNNIIYDVEVGISAFGAEGWIEGNRISNPSDRGVQGNGASLWLDENVIEGAAQGVDLVASNARILGGQLLDNVRGVSLQDSFANLAEVRFEGNQTAVMLSLGDVAVQGNQFVDNIVGIYLVDSPARVLDNNFEANGYAMVTEFSTPVVTANHFHGSTIEAISEGIGSASVVASNLFTDNQDGVVSTVADPHIHNNDFVGGGRAVVLSGGDVRVVNNVFSSQQLVALDASNAADLTAGHNLFWANTADHLGFATNGSELYLDPVYDGSLLPMLGSPLFDAGSQDPNYSDTDGSRSDLGRAGGPYGGDFYTPHEQGVMTLDPQPQYQVDEGDYITIFVQGVHVSNDDPVRFNWDVDQDDAVEFCDSFTGAIDFYARDDGQFQLQVRARDISGGEAVQQVQVEARNVAPSLDWRFLGGPAVEGGFVVVWADAWDPGDEDEVFISVDFEGDGVLDIEDHDVAEGPLVKLWPLPESGSWMSTLIARDDDGGVTEVGEELDVANLPPFLAADPPALLRVGQTLGWVVAAADPSPLDQVVVTLIAGPPGMVVEAGVLRWQPAEAGVFDFALLLTDSDGASASFPSSIEVLEAVEDGCACSALGPRGYVPGWLLVAGLLALIRRRTAVCKV